MFDIFNFYCVFIYRQHLRSLVFVIVVSVRDKNKSYKIAQKRKDQDGKDLFEDTF
jgi:hypothetical protein